MKQYKIKEVLSTKKIISELAENDPINPSHYKDGKYEVIDIMQDKLSYAEFIGYLKGNVIKYVMRAGKKTSSPHIDLKKASWYLDKLIKHTV